MHHAKKWAVVSSIALSALGVIRPASAALVTGFEAPDYTTGSISGQNGWTAGAAAIADNTFNVSAANPISGAQSLVESDVPASPPSGFAPTLISPSTGTGTSSTLTSFQFDFSSVDPTSNAGANHEVYLIGSPADVDQFGVQLYVGGVDFQSNGAILVQEYYPDFGGYMAFADTGVKWTPNTIHNFAINVTVGDPTGTSNVGHMTYTYDGAVLGETRLAVAAGYEQYVGNVEFDEDLSTNGTEKATFDNLSVTAVPEPASLSLLGAVGLLLGRRRGKPLGELESLST